MENGPLKRDDAFLDGLREKSPQVLKEIYRRFFPMLAQHVRSRGGNEEDAQDVFQDAMVVIFRKSKDPHFQLTSAFGTYLLGVGKLIWLKKTSRRGKYPEQGLESSGAESLVLPEKEWDTTERNRLFRTKLTQLGENCQRLLRLFFAGTSMREIAQRLGFSSEGYAKKRKFQCKQKLTQLIKADPAYAELQHKGA